MTTYLSNYDDQAEDWIGMALDGGLVGETLVGLD
jgi:hypothetical protein